jgi:Protein of unknown function (DUF1569)
MKTLLNPRDKEEIASRLQKIQPASSRLWGKMSAHQMICHLSDGFKLYMGVIAVAPVGFPFPSKVMKMVALWAPMQWPQGFKTMKELDQQDGGGTAPAEFERDMNELRNLLERFTRSPRGFPLQSQSQSHPHFGAMSEKEWMRLAYLHCDHHLRQFSA